MPKHRIKILTLKFLVYLKFTCKWVFHIFSGIVFMRLSIPVTFPPFMSLGYSCCPSQEEGVRWPTGDFREGEGAWHRPFVSTSPSLWGGGKPLHLADVHVAQLCCQSLREPCLGGQGVNSAAVVPQWKRART